MKTRTEMLKERNDAIYRMSLDEGYSNYELSVMFNLPEESIQRIVTTLYQINLNKGGRE